MIGRNWRMILIFGTDIDFPEKKYVDNFFSLV